MTDQPTTRLDRRDAVLEAAIRLGVSALLLYWALRILSPFFHVVIWSSIIAVSVYPLFVRLRRLVGGRNRLAGGLFLLLALALLVLPVVGLALESIERAREFATHW
ncbi:MAG TPA: hypothetical protein VD788_04580, partial [Candidatus Polarisedimenticolaceae bacterium]|nr:hypothetical protein [Candidatus Polarisedimenticolaceae bacterium]